MRARLIALVAMTAMTASCLTGCTGGSTSSSGYASNKSVSSMNSIASGSSVDSTNDAVDAGEQGIGFTNQVSYEDEASSEKEEKGKDNQQDSLVEEKLIHKCETTIETLDFDNSYNQLQEILTKYKGIVQEEDFNDSAASYYKDYDYEYNSNSSGYTKGKEGTLIIRIPSESYKKFLSEAGDKLGNVISKRQTTENITTEYYDTTAQVKGLEAQLARLEKMMESTEDIDAIIKINESITQTQNEINSLTTVINTMDRDTTYSFVSITLREVVEYTEELESTKTNLFVDRLKNTCTDTWNDFKGACENLLFALISLTPTIVILGIIILLVRIFLWKKIKRWLSSNNTIAETRQLLNYKEEVEQIAESTEETAEEVAEQTAEGTEAVAEDTTEKVGEKNE